MLQLSAAGIETNRLASPLRRFPIQTSMNRRRG